jgi:hypothetical protein
MDSEINKMRQQKIITVMLALGRLHASGVEFAHGDVRVSDDLAAIGPVDLLIEASAEPSVHAGYDGNPSYLIHSNLVLLHQKFFRRGCLVIGAEQHGHRGSVLTSAAIKRRRIVAIEFGMWRSGRSGGTAGSITFG